LDLCQQKKEFKLGHVLKPDAVIIIPILRNDKERKLIVTKNFVFLSMAMNMDFLLV
jgi:hypothetical protein